MQHGVLGGLMPSPRSVDSASQTHYEWFWEIIELTPGLCTNLLRCFLPNVMDFGAVHVVEQHECGDGHGAIFCHLSSFIKAECDYG